jgi:hypothetical protein
MISAKSRNNGWGGTELRGKVCVSTRAECDSSMSCQLVASGDLHPQA